MGTKKPLLCETQPQSKNQSQNKNQKSHVLRCDKASQNKGAAFIVDVRFGSKADMCAAIPHVRYSPESDLNCYRSVPRQSSARHIVDGTARSSGMHLCVRGQAESASTGDHRPRLALAKRQQPIKTLKTTLNRGPFRLEPRHLHFKQARTAGVSAVGDQDRRDCTPKQYGRRRSDDITPDTRLRIG